MFLLKVTLKLHPQQSFPTPPNRPSVLLLTGRSYLKVMENHEIYWPSWRIIARAANFVPSYQFAALCCLLKNFQIKSRFEWRHGVFYSTLAHSSGRLPCESFSRSCKNLKQVSWKENKNCRNLFSLLLNGSVSTEQGWHWWAVKRAVRLTSAVTSDLFLKLPCVNVHLFFVCCCPSVCLLPCHSNFVKRNFTRVEDSCMK